MSYLAVTPETVSSAASDLAGIGTSISAANAAAAAPITGVVAAAEDEVSAAIASLFSRHGQQFQALSARAAAIHGRLVQALTSAGNSYAAAEAANTNPLQTLEQDVMGAINAPTNALLGRP
ncbi:PE family protein [Mycobacterium interjectum]|nr:PE family protein [Mycobacterium interjectum]